jgi:hypothetical protein
MNVILARSNPTLEARVSGADSNESTRTTSKATLSRALFGFAVLGLASASQATSSGVLSPTCIAPKPNAFLDAYRSHLDIPKGWDPSIGNPRSVARRFVDQSRRAWFGLEWFGPIGGVLTVINCQGAPEASMALGGVEEIRIGPQLPDGHLAYAVQYTSGAGTGFLQRKLALVRFDGTKIRLIWSHTVFELVSGWPGTVDHEDHFIWRYQPLDHSIWVRGTRQNSASSESNRRPYTKALNTEYYCWTDSKSHAFSKCRRCGRNVNCDEAENAPIS